MKNPNSSTLKVQPSSDSVLSFSSVHLSKMAPSSSGWGTGICQLNSNFFVIFQKVSVELKSIIHNFSSLSKKKPGSQAEEQFDCSIGKMKYFIAVYIDRSIESVIVNLRHRAEKKKFSRRVEAGIFLSTLVRYRGWHERLLTFDFDGTL